MNNEIIPAISHKITNAGIIKQNIAIGNPQQNQKATNSKAFITRKPRRPKVATKLIEINI